MKTNEQTLKQKYENIRFFLNENQRRIFLGIEAEEIGYGGISEVSRITGVSRKSISRGKNEFKKPEDFNQNRIRKKGGGRKKTKETDRTLLADLEKLIEPLTRGDPESPLLWTCKSTRKLAKELQSQKHKCSHKMIAELLHELNYSLQSNVKTDEGGKHPDRNTQFEFINLKVKDSISRNQPVISVDAKKKELVGNYKNNGKEWKPKKKPEQVKVYDFIDKQLGKVTPYGVYDIDKNLGWVNVGIDNDTAAFAVESIRQWWLTMGEVLYPTAKELLITADGGGSNSSRSRLWKIELQKLSNETNLTICVCHFPPGTSKWNKIEHRLFSFISQNWRGKPLISHEVIINLIASTTTSKGLKVKSRLDNGEYQKGIKITDKELKEVNIYKEKFHGEWNYKIIPKNIVS